MHGRPSITYHEDKLGFREQLGEVAGRLKGERILVAEAGGGLTMVHYHV